MILECRNQKPVSRRQFEEIRQIIEEIDNNNLPSYLINARKIKEWMTRQENTAMPPRESARNSEEKKLGMARMTIKRRLLKRICGMSNR